MTTLAALVGGVPLMLGAGTGSQIRQPLGYAIVGGLLNSQLWTLFTTPVVYIYMDRLSGWLERRARQSRRSSIQRRFCLRAGKGWLPPIQIDPVERLLSLPAPRRLLVRKASIVNSSSNQTYGAAMRSRADDIPTVTATLPVRDRPN
jgi:hypothetical protein